MADSSLEGEPANGTSAAADDPNAGSGSSRPSFTDYWKRTKEAATRRITFVSSNQGHLGLGSKDGRRHRRNRQKSAESEEAVEEDEEADLSAGGGNSSSGNNSSSAQARVQARRAQVRKAQAQHRQRKANYTKQLEMDVVRLRDLIDVAERDTLALKAENDAIRRRLATARLAGASPSSSSYLPSALPPPSMPLPPIPTASASTAATAAAATTSAFASGTFSFPTADAPIASPQHAPGYTVRLSVSPGMVTPSFKVTRTPAHVGAAARGPSPAPSSLPPSWSGAGFDVGVDLGEVTSLSEAQVDHAINFILGLEHVCWEHFGPSYFAYQDYDASAPAHGHALMASAIALQSAPPAAFARIDTAKQGLRTGGGHTLLNADGSENVLASWQTPAGDPGLTLANLYGLASALNPRRRGSSKAHQHQHHQQQLRGRSQTWDNPNPHPYPRHPLGHAHTLSDGQQGAPASASLAGDDLDDDDDDDAEMEDVWDPEEEGGEGEEELAPVQAWFEVARRYGGAAVADAARMDALRAQLAPRVTCPHFGAAVARSAFEDAVLRVLGRPRPPPKSAGAAVAAAGGW
ncbi:hypothetical protein GGS23DRAFT_298634 [Durotheca rogersii]|uniref:uncharacterized protein n=1 Tax=Durotheca rogersii TaxID=419775 RepID=UPI00221EB7E7|nr:uncharacterized protein GGS23DRAFT_298634 [Durotheca rogersii]KAI5866971.1 hypothetical protein GGS23DRAFT_298634 [Durotheca rogersii]